MNGKDIELTRRRVLGGVATIGAASAAAGAGTFAYFNDEETSTGNVITAGTLDLKTDTTGQIAITDIVPGDTAPKDGTTTTIQATYDENSSVNPVEVDISISIAEPANEPTEPDHSSNATGSEFAQQLQVDVAKLMLNGAEQNDLTSTQGVSTAADLDGVSIDDAYGDVSPTDTIGLEVAFTLPTGVGNTYQADGVSIEPTWTAQQDGAD